VRPECTQIIENVKTAQTCNPVIKENVLMFAIHVYGYMCAHAVYKYDK